MIVMISGGFDPLHVGHLALIRGAAQHGRVLIALNSDDWLIRKKGYWLMPWDERAQILEAIRDVSIVCVVHDQDDTVCDALTRYRPHYFANGGDRESANAQEDAVCRKFGIKQLFGVGGAKVTSSSDMVRQAAREMSQYDILVRK